MSSTTPQNTPTTMLPRTGDVFAFQGLDGDDLDGRTVKIVGISVTGRLQFQIRFMGEEPHGLHDAALSDALAMIQHGVWRHVDEPPLP